METASRNTIMLEIEGKIIICNRMVLTNHSDYFRAMLEGNFVERNKDIICLNEIEFVAMETILKQLQNRNHIIEEENILSVLQAACMLQFLGIKATCVKRLQEILSVKNCLQIWICTEYLSCEEGVCLKAKHLALKEFMFLKDTYDFLALTLEQIGIELVAMKTILKLLWDREYIIEEENLLSVLQAACMLQFLEIKETCIRRVEEILSVKNCLKIWLYAEYLDLKAVHLKAKFLALVEFMSVKDTDYFLELSLGEIMNYLGSVNLQCSDELVVFRALIKWYHNVSNKNDDFILKLLHCLDFTKLSQADIHNMIAELEIERNQQILNILHYVKMSVLKNLFDMDSEKAANLDGFKMIGYKQFIYLYGGEYHLGRGNWNRTFYMFDLIKEKWIQKDSLPCARRHFESCICGNYLFIVGGTGPFRVIRENIFWYNLSDESWSEEVELPCYGRQLKCCPFDDKLFVLNINNKCGYSFNPDSKTWTKLDICDSNNVLPYYSEILSVFSYKSSLYIKECKLLELKLQENRLVIVREIVLMNVEKNSCQVESVLCNNMLYSLNKQFYKESNEEVIFLESFNVDTFEISYIFQNTSDDDNETFKFRPSLVIFNVLHQNLVDGNDLVNDFV
ncbi:kelch-like protein 38 [Asbolus verrucosus]|uniref:Kelch-like protein 38 n=1 Tax=Asbolus verrucosus TaxID=1661398 RepID=A0A482W7R4_ASBVE|nr:kelch-like protein 38 [Asbolus verrucosus]